MCNLLGTLHPRRWGGASPRPYLGAREVANIPSACNLRPGPPEPWCSSCKLSGEHKATMASHPNPDFEKGEQELVKASRELRDAYRQRAGARGAEAATVAYGRRGRKDDDLEADSGADTG